MKKIKQSFLRLLYPLKKVWWFIRRPNTKGAKCLIFHGEDVLLVKLAYAHRKWSVPGGGVDSGESCAAAAIREAKEEVGVELTQVEYIGEYTQQIEYKNDTVQCFVAQAPNRNIQIDEFEISEARWFAPGEIHSVDVARSVPYIMNLYYKNSGFPERGDNMVRSQI